ncbi:MAG: tetratricopeptide repeat protein [Nitrospinaceae bacterium]|nr:tetratricopeptide repeat protein [Nitrospinaceae bacterium]NIR57930.1 tetratricopeptide repeat protein [Nitrospinaceae bacterium]NIS88390.1 tetratricopeptide repeat protein [Nitrospinaceae bacterium]NIT85266.1 tetratricopeptide repeat protein [Nitrospinaceae bacterium]NIU47421.1 tetratricopeptide repeat protein [Nitrospinaceae bacterium]
MGTAFLWIFLVSCIGSSGDALIQKANREWIKGRNHSAIELFKAVLEKYPSGLYAQEALFRLGEIYHFSLGNSKQALLYFQEVRQMDRQGPFSYEAQKYIAEIVEFSFKDYPQAIIEYQNLIQWYPDRAETDDHQYRIASIYYKMQNRYQALVELQTLLEQYPDTPWLEEALFKIVEILYTLDRCDEAQTYYEHFATDFPKSRHRDEIEFVMASCLEEGGHLREAFERFRSLKGSYPYPAVLETKLAGLKNRMKHKKIKRR